MLLEEFDIEKYERTMREDGRIEGREEGRTEGRAEMHRELLKVCHEMGLDEKTVLELTARLNAVHNDICYSEK